ncbi:MAG: hypothetical protein JW819_11565 [Candidatus Krumholzibacteriota bacterium]|nr:hypothetical protein [Candidatus Krumholzibacteriota bacterium]
MFRRIWVPGLLGGHVLIFWTLIVNGLLGFQARLDMRPVHDERRVHAVLAETVTEPGRYIVNPPLVDGRYPAGEPVFSILYGGVGHEAAGPMLFLMLCLVFVGPFIAAALLAAASRRVLASFPRKVLFVGAIGLLFAVMCRLPRHGIGDYPLGDAALYALHDVAVWLLVALVLAWRIRPRGEA